MFRTRAIIPSQRMAADKPRSATPTCQACIHGGDNAFFRTSGVGDERGGGADGSRLDDTLGNRIHWSADDHELSVRNSFRQTRNAVVDGADLTCCVEAGLPPADADDRPCELPFPQRQTDRATDQADSHNGDRIVLSHAGILRSDSPRGEGARPFGRVACEARRFTDVISLAAASIR
jgi:hypothetical protein